MSIGAEQLLSLTGLYSDIERKVTSEGVKPFAPQYPLWSDGAEKARWIFLPQGSAIDSSDMNRWVFPVGTRVWKEFKLGGKRVETRLIAKMGSAADINSWELVTYRWNEAETEATLVLPQGVANAASTEFPGISFDIPSQFQCKRCHERGGDPVLGFDALQLSNDIDPNAPHGEAFNASNITLQSLVEANLLTINPPTPPRITASSPAARAAQGYFHGNCGACHNPFGTASFTGLFLRYDLHSATLMDTPAYQTAVNKLTSGFEVPGRTLGLDSFRIEAKELNYSAIPYRMSRRENFEQMPPIATKVPDYEAIGLIYRWIFSLPTTGE